MKTSYDVRKKQDRLKRYFNNKKKAKQLEVDKHRKLNLEKTTETILPKGSEKFSVLCLKICDDCYKYHTRPRIKLLSRTEIKLLKTRKEYKLIFSPSSKQIAEYIDKDGNEIDPHTVEEEEIETNE